MESTLRPAEPKDVHAIYDLIAELATFENGLDQVSNTPEQLLRDGFSENPLYYCIVAEIDQQIIGISLYYFRYSTWRGKILYLEDLIVTQSHRGKGIGKALLDTTIQIAQETQCKGMRWQVLDWNTSAIEFYKTYDVSIDEEWLNVEMFF